MCEPMMHSANNTKNSFFTESSYLKVNQIPPSPRYLRAGDQGFIYNDRVFLVGRKEKKKNLSTPHKTTPLLLPKQ